MNGKSLAVMSTARMMAAWVLLGVALAGGAEPLGSAFTYQGELEQGGNPADGDFDFEFGLFDAASGGAQVGASVTVEDVAVAAGTFTLELDFGNLPFAGDRLWLEIGIRDGASTDPFTSLVPRQQLTAAPYALHAEMVAMDAISTTEIADNSITAADLAANSVGVSELASNSVGSAEITDGSIRSSDLAANQVGSTAIADGSIRAVDLAANSVGAWALADNAVDSAAIAAGAVGSSDINVNQVQRRVSGTCASGTFLAGINADGSVICSVLPVGLVRTLDSGDVGTYTDIAVRLNGRPILSYYDQSNADLKVFDCTNVACSSGIARIVDSSGDVGQYTSLAVRPGGLPIISYYDVTNGNLKIFDCFGTSCSSGTVRTLDSAGDVGLYTSIAIRLNGLPIVSYIDQTNGDLKVFDCANTACSSGTVRTRDSDVLVGNTSIAIRPSDLPIIVYGGADEGGDLKLKVHSCLKAGCTSGLTSTLGSLSADRISSIAVRPTGLPIISYVGRSGFSRRFRVYDCANSACSSGGYWNVATIQDLNIFIQHTDIAVRPSGLPLIAYGDLVNDHLEVYDCADAGCSSGIARKLDDAGSVGSHARIAIRENGLPIISHHDSSNGSIKIYSCGDDRCEN